MIRSLALVLLLAAATAHAQPRRGPPPDFPVDPATRDALVRDILRQLDAKFVFPDRLKAQRPALERRWSSPPFTQLATADAIERAINADLREAFHDRHLGLMRPPPGMPMPSAEAAPEAPPSAGELAAMEREEARRHYGFVRAEILDGNIGYLRIDGFADGHLPGTRRAVADAMSFVGDSDALIIDERANHGGDGDTVALLMSYLLDGKKLLLVAWDRVSGKTEEDWTLESVPAGRRYGTRRPVYVLTSRETFSAGEEFAYDVQTLKRGTLVGETTGGGANHNIFVPVAGGKFGLSIPYGTVRSPVTNTNWEGVGVKPEVAVPRDQALETALAAARKAIGTK
jgi:hypothetical protein